jgi:hypothetical protein
MFVVFILYPRLVHSNVLTPVFSKQVLLFNPDTVSQEQFRFILFSTPGIAQLHALSGGWLTRSPSEASSGGQILNEKFVHSVSVL